MSEHKDMMTLGNQERGYTCISKESFAGPRGKHLFFFCSWEDLSPATAHITLPFIQQHSWKSAGEQQCHFFINSAEPSSETGGFVMVSISAKRATTLSREALFMVDKMNINTKLHPYNGILLGLHHGLYGAL